MGYFLLNMQFMGVLLYDDMLYGMLYVNDDYVLYGYYIYSYGM